MLKLLLCKSEVNRNKRMSFLFLIKSEHILVSRRSHSNGDVVRHLGFLNRFFAYWRSIREVYSVIDRLHVTGFIQWVCDILVRGEIKSRFWDCWNGFLNNRAIAAYLFMEYFLRLWFIAIFIHYLTQKAHFHFLKLVIFLSFWVNCCIMLEPSPAQPLPLRNIDLSIVVLLNKHENNNINKATPYAISFDNTNYIHCLYNLQLFNQS